MPAGAERETAPGPLSVLHNPIFVLEMGGLRVSWRALVSRRGWALRGNTLAFSRSTLARHLLLFPLLAGAPHYFEVANRLLHSFLPGAPPFPAEHRAALAMVGLLTVVFSLALAPTNTAATCITGERERRTLDALLLTRMTAPEILLGKAAVRLIPLLLVFTLALPFWLLWPPVPPDAWGVAGTLRLSIRPFLLLVWADAVAVAVASCWLGLAVSAWLRRSQWAPPLATLLVVLPVLFAAGLYAPRFAPQVLSLMAGGWVDGMDLRLHAAVWAASALASYAGFLAAQAGLESEGGRVRLRPGGRATLRSSRRLVLAAALLLAAATGVSGVRVGRTVAEVRADLLAITGPGGLSSASSLMKAGSYAQGLALVRAEIRARPHPLSAPFLREVEAACLMRLGRYREAAAAFDAARKGLEGTCAAARSLTRAGYCREKLGEKASARRNYREGIAILQDACRRGAYPFPGLADIPGDALSLAAGLARAGDRAGAEAAYGWIARQKWPNEAAEARDYLAILREGLDRAPRLGVTCAPPPPPLHVALVTAGAQAAGLASGDRVVAVDGRPVAGYLALRRALARRRAGDTVPVVVERKGKRLTFRVRLTEPD